MKTNMGTTRRLLLALFALPALTPALLFAGNPEAGKALAEQWCRSCHVIAAEDTMASDGAPSFLEVAQDPATSEEGLRAWLFNPHPPMPNFNLSQREIDDLAAYILSLSP